MPETTASIPLLDPTSPGTRALLGLVLLFAALLLIGADWARHEAAVARCAHAGVAFDAALGRCDVAPVLAAAE